MQVLIDWSAFPHELRGGVLCVGKFDGLHLGHIKMLSTGRAEASRRNVPFTIMTFDPHPNVLLKPETQHRLLTTHEQRLEILATFHPDVLIIIPTSREFLSTTAEDFLSNVVAGPRGLGVSLLVEGPSFTFGRGARGTVETLRQLGPTHGFETIIVPTQQQSLSDLTLINVSSSLIRWLIQQGRVADAAKTLGRPYTLRGTIVPGARRGRSLGFPTANLQTPQLIPAAGIYAALATLGGRPYRAAVSIGNNPTFHADAPTTVEAFLLDLPSTAADASGDLYGQTLDLAFIAWLRDMYSFAGAAPLVAQIHRDVAQTRDFITRPTLSKESA